MIYAWGPADTDCLEFSDCEDPRVADRRCRNGGLGEGSTLLPQGRDRLRRTFTGGLAPESIGTAVNDAFWILLGLVIGFAASLAVILVRRRSKTALTQQLLEATERERDEQTAAVLNELKATFASLSREALSANTDDFLKLAKTRFDQQTSHADQTLEGKKKLIDARLEEMGAKLNHLNNLIQAVEKQRAQSQGSLTSQMEKVTQATNRLQDTTTHLREALANPQRRGQWGERMAEDVLRLAGLVEGVNYIKQQRLPGGSVPDFTFFLPGGQHIHMDVKFPLANYLKMLDASDEATRASCESQFLRDVRSRIKEVTTRGYINPAEGTLDYMLVFIPVEQTYGFIHEHDSTVLDDALKNKIVLCSPLTLYAILAVIRQAVDNFRLEQVSSQILTLLAEFKKQWAKYVEGMDKMGERLEAATKEFEKLKGVRTRQLERQLDRIDDLHVDREEQALLTSETAPSSLLPPTGESD